MLDDLAQLRKEGNGEFILGMPHEPHTFAQDLAPGLACRAPIKRETMAQCTLPKMNMDTSETGCCPRFAPTGWDDAELEFHDRPFVRSTTVNFMHIPLNMGSMMTKTWKKIQDAGAAPSDEYLVLSTDRSPWRGEHNFAVTKNVPNAQNVTLSGTFLAKVFEGPYRNAGKWAEEMKQFVAAKGKQLRKLYFFYTTCPRCAKHFGKNYVVVFAEFDS
ncbi:MAG TPA: hydrolase [Pirellulales bacterium]|nr:hydrolase [Pirellulales bacterium]